MKNFWISDFSICLNFKFKFQAKERVQEVEAKWITDKAALDARLLELVKEREKMETEFETQKGNWTRTMGKTYENRPFLLLSVFR